jgi:hypothetical protein
MQKGAHPESSAWLAMATLCIMLMACGRIGFDSVPPLDGDSSIPDIDGSPPDPDSGNPGQDAGPLVPQPDEPISDGTADPSCPVVAWTGTEFVIAWIDQRDGNEEVYLARLDETGAKIGADIRVTVDGSRSRNPAIAGTGSGFAIAWADDRDGNSEIYLARFADDASRIGGDIRVTDAAESSSHPSVAWTGNTYALSWQDLRDGDLEIYAARLSASGIKLGSDVRIMDAPGLSLGPSVVWSGRELLIAWRDESAGGGSQLFFAQVDAAGNEIGQETQITTQAMLMLSQSIAWTGAETLALWDDNRNGNFDIYGARIDSSGNKIGDDIRITTDGAGGIEPSLAWNGSEAGMTWQSERGDEESIYMTRLTAQGEPIGSEMRISNALGTSKCADIVWTGSQYGIAWLNDQLGIETIYFARVLQ